MKLLKIVFLIWLVASLMGCAVGIAPVTGFLYTNNVGGAMLATQSSGKATKVGTATAKSVLGLYAYGDSSIETAAKSAGIVEIHHVDYKTRSILGIWAETTTFVYGR